MVAEAVLVQVEEVAVEEEEVDLAIEEDVVHEEVHEEVPGVVVVVHEAELK